MSFKMFRGCMIVMSLLLAGTVFGETESSNNGTYTMEAVEVTAERVNEHIKNNPQNVEVVERGEIDRRGLLSVEEALNTMSGVEVYQSSGVGSRVSIRGSGRSGGVLVLLNGRPLNTNQFGGVDLGSIPIEMIESITVFKPPVPVWLGPGATDGAINIATRDLAAGSPDSKEKPSTVRAGAGSFGLAEGSASRVVPVAGGNMLLTGAGTHRDGKRSNSYKDDGSFSAGWNREEKNGTRYEVNARYYMSDFGSSGPLDNETPDAWQQYRKGSVDARIAGMLGETGTFSINPYGDAVTLKDHSQSGSTSTLDDIKAGIKSEVAWSEKQGLWNLRIGAVMERDDLDHTQTGRHQRTMGDLGGQYDRRFGPVTGTLGIRGNYTNDFLFNPGFTAGFGWALTEKTLLKAKGGYSVNLPTFGQLYQTSHGSIDQVRGNPDLDKERTWSYDLGMEYRLGKERLFQATLFGSETRDLIIPQRGTDKIYRPVNIGSAWRYGMELTMKYGWAAGLAVEADVILQTSRNGDTGGDLPYTPGMKLKTGLQYTLPGTKTRLEGTLRYESSRYSEAQNLSSERLDPYTVVDVKTIQPFFVMGCASEWFVKVDNIFNRIYESHYGYPDEGIRFATGIQVRF